MFIWTMRRKLTRVFLPLLIMLVNFYFAYHAIQGERGIWGWVSMIKQLKEAEKYLADLSKEKEAYEKKVLFMGTRIDPDLLEEQLRSLLGYVRSDEIVILGRLDGEKEKPW